MKKILACILVTGILFCTSASAAEVQIGSIEWMRQDIANIKERSLEKFQDIRAGDWYTDNVAILTEKGIINGYEDNTFKPNNAITVAQFLKIVLVASGNPNIPNGPEYWASTYIEQAKKLGIIGEEFETNYGCSPCSYNVNINRTDMARIVVKAFQISKEVQNVVDFEDILKDLKSIPEKDLNHVLIAYRFGILGGFPDGEFKGQNGATRAEASTILMRVLDKNIRLKTNIGQERLKSPDISRLNSYEYIIPEGEKVYKYDEIVSNVNEDFVSRFIELAKEWDKLFFNVDFKNIPEDYKSKLLSMVSPNDIIYEIYDYRKNENLERITQEEYVTKYIEDIKKNKVIRVQRFLTNPATFYSVDGVYKVRGTIVFRIDSSSTSYLPKDVKLGTWYKQDVEYSFMTKAVNGEYKNVKIYTIKYLNKPTLY